MAHGYPGLGRRDVIYRNYAGFCGSGDWLHDLDQPLDGVAQTARISRRFGSRWQWAEFLAVGWVEAIARTSVHSGSLNWKC